MLRAILGSPVMNRSLAAHVLAAAFLLAPTSARAVPDSLTAEITVDAKMKNPTEVSGLRGTTWNFLEDTFQMERNCYGYTTRDPGMIIKLGGHVGEIDVAVPGAQMLVLRIDRRRIEVECGDSNAPLPRLRVKKLEGAQTIEVFAATHDQNTKMNYTVRVEDPRRPLELPFGPKTPRFKIAGEPRVAIEQSALLAPKSGGSAYEAGCDGMFFQKQPEMVLDVGHATTDLSLEVRSSHKVGVLLVGPYGKDGRPPPGRCSTQMSQLIPKLETGLYAVRVGHMGNGAVVHVVVRGKKSTRDPLLPGKFVPDELPYAERLLRYHFPLLEPQDVIGNDDVRQHLFDVAPGSLFVFGERDMNEHTAYIDPSLGKAGAREVPAEAPVEYPRRDEPMLLLDPERVLTADGNIFQVDRRDLADNLRFDPALPAKPRNASILFDYAKGAPDGSSDEKTVAEYHRLAKEAKECVPKVWEPIESRIKALRAQPFSDKREAQIRQLEQQAKQQEDRQCGGLTEKKKSLREGWIKSRTERRAAALAKLKRRFEQLFPASGK